MSTPVPVFSGVVTLEGVVRLDARALFHRYIKTLANQPITLVVKRLTRRKSTQQLGYLFGVVYPVIAEELGYREYEVDEVHDAIVRVLRGQKPEPNPLGLRWSLREQDHEETSAYIEDVRHWALTTHGIVTPDAAKVEVPALRKEAA